jgi:hypothetical protein
LTRRRERAVIAQLLQPWFTDGRRVSIIVCKTRLLTPTQAATAMRRGLDINPANAIDHGTLSPPGADGSAAWPWSSRGAGRRAAPI